MQRDDVREVFGCPDSRDEAQALGAEEGAGRQPADVGVHDDEGSCRGGG